MAIAFSGSSLDETWSHVVERVRHELPETAVAMWFSDVRPSGIADGDLELKVPSAYVRDRLARNHLGLLERAAEEVIGYPVHVRFRVESRPQENQPSHGSDEPPLQRRTGADRTPGAPGLPFPAYTFDAFVSGPSNRFAHAAAMAVAEAPPSKAYNPLFIYGGVGLR